MLSKKEVGERIKAGMLPDSSYWERHLCEEALILLEGVDDPAEAIASELEGVWDETSQRKIARMLLNRWKSTRRIQPQQRALAKRVIDGLGSIQLIHAMEIVGEDGFGCGER